MSKNKRIVGNIRQFTMMEQINNGSCLCYNVNCKKRSNLSMTHSAGNKAKTLKYYTMKHYTMRKVTKILVKGTVEFYKIYKRLTCRLHLEIVIR